MAINITTDTLLSLPAAARNLGLHVQTIRRWMHSGLNGRKLEVIRIGRAIRTTPEALQAFANAQTGLELPPAPLRSAERLKTRLSRAAKHAARLKISTVNNMT